MELRTQNVLVDQDLEDPTPTRLMKSSSQELKCGLCNVLILA